MDIKGVLIGIRSYSFPDQNSGELIQGGKIYVAVPSDDTGAVGHAVSEIPYDYANHSRMAQLVPQLVLKPITVQCSVQLTGRKTKLKAVEIKAA